MALNTHIAQTSVDFQGLAELRRSANSDQTDQQTIRKVAGQFESLFINMMLKSMRQASLADGIFDSSQSDMYRDITDQQLAIDLAEKGGFGLQEAIIRQLGGQLDNNKSIVSNSNEAKSYSYDTVSVRPALIEHKALLQQVIKAVPEVSAIEQADPSGKIIFNSPESFVQQLWPMAKQAADKIGVKPEVLLAQAALETGWGKHILTKGEDQSSHNLFNIKADNRWGGAHVSVGAIEYRDGLAVKEQSQFRVYDSYQQSFDDYVDFLQTHSRYQQALEHSQDSERFIEELHKAGYATDPAYSNKIKRIMSGDTLVQLSEQLKYS